MSTSVFKWHSKYVDADTDTSKGGKLVGWWVVGWWKAHSLVSRDETTRQGQKQLRWVRYGQMCQRRTSKRIDYTDAHRFSRRSVVVVDVFAVSGKLCLLPNWWRFRSADEARFQSFRLTTERLLEPRTKCKFEPINLRVARNQFRSWVCLFVCVPEIKLIARGKDFNREIWQSRFLGFVNNWRNDTFETWYVEPRN